MAENSKIEWTDIDEIIARAKTECMRAIVRYPQPNYIISKLAEESGEVVKSAIHCAEGRDTTEHVKTEIVQTMAMLFRLLIEGDQVHGLPPLIMGNRLLDGKTHNGMPEVK